MKPDRKNLEAESIIEQLSNSGMTQVEFARSNNITLHTLRYWLYKRRKKSKESGSFIELKNIFNGNNILLRYPNGVELHVPAGTSLQTLKALISL
jgi:hypothetical protein